MIFVQPYLILALWVSSKNVVVKCGWVNVCKWSQRKIWEINDAQDNGIVPARISSSHFEITMRLARLNVFKSWSVLSWPTCLQVAKSTPLTARRQNRRFGGFLQGLGYWCILFRYKSDSQIKAMTDLVDAYQRREVHLAEKILRGAVVHFRANWVKLELLLRQPLYNHGRPIYPPIHRRTSPQFTHSVSYRSHKALHAPRIIIPCKSNWFVIFASSCIHRCLQQQLNVDTREVEDLLVDLILEGKVEGRIDQAGKRLELDSKYVHRSSSLY